MTTGVHIVRDIFCIKCDEQVGWKYVRQMLPAFSCPYLPSPCPAILAPDWLTNAYCYSSIGSCIRSFSTIQRGQIHPGEGNDQDSGMTFLSSRLLRRNTLLIAPKLEENTVSKRIL